MSLRIVVAGGSGMIGSALVPYLKSLGHEVVLLKRNSEQHKGYMPLEALDGSDAIINLAGYSLLKKRWTKQVREKIVSSRLTATQALSDAIRTLKKPPKLFISASAAGYYGDCGDAKVTEESPPGSGFLAALCRDWEEEALKAASSQTRVVCLRIGLVLTPEAGLLATLLPLFRLGLGGTLGSGKQYMSWIAMEDLLELIHFVLQHPELAGAVNATAPIPVTNKTFTDILAKAVHRPAWFSAPSWLLRLVLGKIADEAILIGARVYPQKAIDAGFRFLYNDLHKINFVRKK
ncbi:MAG: TIGR01777 family oxidoreductase [Verrucomicrobia bacterium]|nr:TIGR01777 family oxidoreductase [Verrucomicrobiota bacterium]